MQRKKRKTKQILYPDEDIISNFSKFPLQKCSNDPKVYEKKNIRDCEKKKN